MIMNQFLLNNATVAIIIYLGIVMLDFLIYSGVVTDQNRSLYMVFTTSSIHLLDFEGFQNLSINISKHT